jgi:hypothetical protein
MVRFCFLQLYRKCFAVPTKIINRGKTRAKYDTKNYLSNDKLKQYHKSEHGLHRLPWLFTGIVNSQM